MTEKILTNMLKNTIICIFLSVNMLFAEDVLYDTAWTYIYDGQTDSIEIDEGDEVEDYFYDVESLPEVMYSYWL